MTHDPPSRWLPLAAALLLVASAGCATRGFVRGELATANQRIDDVESQVETNQDRLTDQDRRIDHQGQHLETVEGTASGASKTASEALERAIAAGKLAEGKLLFETVLADDQVRFGFDQADLGPEARDAIALLASQLKERNENVYLEIQGHTDATGTEAYNMELGQARAEAVRRLLNGTHGLPLHRMSVISYGESAPVADNATREGRSKNRRVVLVVLK